MLGCIVGRLEIKIKNWEGHRVLERERERKKEKERYSKRYT